MDTPGNEQDTVEFLPDEGFSEGFFAKSLRKLDFEFGALTHVGKVRTNNEDHFAVVKRHRDSDVLLTNLAIQDLAQADDDDFILIVADGMGGERFGEFASRMAVAKTVELMRQATSWVTKFTDLDRLHIRERVDAYIHEIQTTLTGCVDDDPSLAGMGTTWTSAHLLSSDAIIAHVGDSRAYLMADGELQQITRDETMAQAFVDAGMNPASVKRYRHLLLNSLGSDKGEVTAQVYHVPVSDGDQILLCTDGLTEMVSLEAIAAILKQAANPQTACELLVAAALENGGKDNITVVLAWARRAA